MRRLLALIFWPIAALFRLVRWIIYGSVAPDAGIPTSGVFVDLDRGRSVAYRVWQPFWIEKGDPPKPVVIFSHGLGGSKDGAPYLGRALAEAGYWGFFIQHRGSDAGVIEDLDGGAAVAEALLASIMNIDNMVNRFADLPFVLDELERLNSEDGPFQGLLDLDNIGMAGHSYGARSVLTAAGQVMGAAGTQFADDRIRAGLALSPTAGRGLGDDEMLPPEHFAMIAIPILHVTGTEDRPPMGDAGFDPAIRTLPYQMIPAEEQYLLVFDGAAHDDFSGTTARGKPATDTRYTMITAEVALLFFDAYLKDNEAAWTNLRGTLAEHLDPGDHFEYR